jgi:Flp pilus assembly pilin Flp
MAKPFAIARALWLGEEGATVVEYVLMILAVAVACFVAVSALGVSLTGSYQSAVNGLS